MIGLVTALLLVCVFLLVNKYFEQQYNDKRESTYQEWKVEYENKYNVKLPDNADDYYDNPINHIDPEKQ